MFQILIVEDDKELSQLFQNVLEKNGYQVKSASDGALALEILDKEYIDLIISDIMMPVMDGYEPVSYTHLQDEFNKLISDNDEILKNLYASNSEAQNSLESRCV